MERSKRKIIVGIITLLFIIGISACGISEKNNDSQDNAVTNVNQELKTDESNTESYTKEKKEAANESDSEKKDGLDSESKESIDDDNSYDAPTIVDIGPTDDMVIEEELGIELEEGETGGGM